MADPPRPLDPEQGGVPLSLYAAVCAYTGDGVPLAPSLDHAGLAPEAWPAIEQAWIARLAASAAEDGALIAASDEHRIAALAHVERRLPPLDEDVSAWLDFFRAFSASEDPSGFLGARGMIEGDVFRLLDHWQPRMTGDPTVRDRAVEVMGKEPGPVPEVRPALPRLKPETRWPRRTIAAPAAASATPPKLATTGVAMPDLSKLPLPFAKQKEGAPPPAAAIPGPVIQPKRGLGDTAPAFSAPVRPAVPFGAGAIEPARAAPPVEPPAPPVEPVAPVAPPPIVAAPTITAPPIVAGPTIPAQPSPVVPPRSPLAGTSLDVRVSASPALPFAPGNPAIALAPAASSSATQKPGLGDTSPVVAPSAPALPFAPETRLDLQAYAMMQAEITADRAGAMATIARYGLTPETKRNEDAGWKAKLAADPALRMAWVQALAAAGERLRGRR